MHADRSEQGAGMSGRMLKNISVRGKLLVVYSVLLVVVHVALGSVATHHFETAFEQHSLNEVRDSANAVATAVSAAANVSIRNHLRGLSEMGRSTVRRYYELAAAGEMTEAQAKRRAIQVLLAHRIGASGYLYVLDSAGNVVAHPIEGMTGRNFADNPVAKRQISERDGYLEYDWQNPEDRAPRAKALYMCYFSPWDWIISASAYRSEFRYLLRNGDFREAVYASQSSDVTTLLLDKDGTVLLHSPMPPGTEPDALLPPELLRSTLTTRRDTRAAIINFEGTPTPGLLSFRTLPEFDWTVVALATREKILLPVETFRTKVIIGLGASLCLFLLMSQLLGGLIASPLRRLKDLFARGAEGDPSVRADEDGNDEFGLLGQYFNRLMERLSAQRDELEERVRERTNELVSSNEKLRAQIVERIQAEEQFKEQVLFLETLLRTIPNPVFHKDARGRYQGCNPAFARLLYDTNPGNVVGHTSAEIQRVHAPEAGDELHKMDMELIASGGERHYELAHLCADGRERMFFVTKATFTDNTGHVAGLIGVMLDITSRRAAEAIRMQLEQAIEQTAEAIVITDAHSVIQYVNSGFERTTGYSRGEVIGNTPRIYKSGVHPREFYDRLWATLRAGEIWRGTITNRRKNGRHYEAELTISPVKNQKGAITNFVGIQADVTEKRIMERQLLQAQKLESIGQLASGIAHEINTPIQFVGDNANFIRDSLGDLLGVLEVFRKLLEEAQRRMPEAPEVERAREVLDEVDIDFLMAELPRAALESLDGVERVSSIVRAMKEFSHPGGEDKTLTDINKAIMNTITVSRNEWKYVAEMVPALAPDLPLVPCLPGEFNQVVLNLIVNAAQAIGERLERESSEETGRITITTRHEGPWCEIRVSDTGIGIPEDVLPLIFDPFFTTKEIGKGTGQGLTITRSAVVDKHGGTLDVESVPGEGTTFIVRLPLAEES